MNRVAIVTGASRGIGAATAAALSRAGYAVVLAARDSAALSAHAATITAAGGTALAVPTDVTDADAVRRLVARTMDEFGRLDAAVNNAAGGGHRPTPLAEVAVADFDSALAVSLRGVFLGMKYQIPAMLATGTGGSIVNMSSTAGLRAVGGLAGYVTAKSGLVGLTRTAALDYAEAGIRVNALAPGPILTDHLERAGDAVQKHVAATLPARRLGQVDEVAQAVVWLCGPDSAFVTGATLPVDGGMLAGQPPFQR
ncbi:SDR family NAD(P)-dependent oxidoreductase [Pseudonocardia acaciae]|uniref:SDR family NAD(P)-dependent oxidoreductase n=1 Tax=Pseudonocardia acaciae TaxID=551276 RepID=UPI00048BC479|nr:SDR family NAD(P)-dependent oxidoreductase [Pseudonocardia acaciae]